MNEIDLKLKNDMPFGALSGEFPDLLIYRWCNSAVDYLEFYGKERDLFDVSKRLGRFAKALNTHIVYESVSQNRLSVLFSCRCSIDNSAIRVIEAHNCLWQAPVAYQNGIERIKVISLSALDFGNLYRKLEQNGSVEIERKVEIDPDSLKDLYLIPVSSLFKEFSNIQLLALRSAMSHGYFRSPKKTDIAELARIEGKSKSTTQEHLNKAINKLASSMESYINLMIEFRRNRLE